MHIEAIALASLNSHILVIDNRIGVAAAAVAHTLVQLEVDIAGIHSIVAVGTARRNRVEGSQESGTVVAVLDTIDVDKVHIIGCTGGDGLIVADLHVCLLRLVNRLCHVGDILFLTGAHGHCHQQQ